MKLEFSDTEVLQLIRAGNKSAFNLLYNSYVELLYNYGCRFSPDKELVKDSIQDVFVELWRRKDRLPEIGSFRAYLIKSARYTIQRKIRKSLADHLKTKAMDGFQIELSSEAQIVLTETVEELNDRLRRSVNLLPSQQREVIFHIFYHRLSFDEAASVMSLSKKSVYNLMHLGLEKLRAAMKGSPALIGMIVANTLF